MSRQIIMWVILLALWGCSLPSGIPDTATFRQLQQQAQGGDVESQYQLGLQYSLDSERTWDHIRGHRWFETAAEGGHADAQYMVGMGKLLGRGTLYDKVGAVAAFGQAARQGQARAQYQLGLAYLNGNGVGKDKPWGRQWLEQAAWNGHPEAQFMLGALFAKGVAGQQDRAEAWRWLERSRQKGHPRSAMALERLQEDLSQHDRVTGKRLLEQQSLVDADGLYLSPKVRYVQAVLNRLGYPVGSEDGLYGPMTAAAATSFVKVKQLPLEIQIMPLIESLRGSY